MVIRAKESVRCPDENTLSSYLVGEATAKDIHVVRAHIDECVECRQLVAEFMREAPLRAPPRDAEERVVLHVEALYPGIEIGDQFVLVECLGSGGMGVVWAARTYGGREVALKFLRTEDAEHRRRLLREARIARSVTHPHLVGIREVLDSPQLSGPVLVMDRVHGRPLEERLATGAPLTLSETATLLAPVVQGVAHAHAQGIVHRDLKPSNILVEWNASPFPRAHVLDFGVAKILFAGEGESARITRSGAVLGTPQYMAPEQLFGEGEIDRRADVWSVGAILYQCLAGVAPISVRTFGEVFKVMTIGKIQALRELMPGLPETVLLLIDTMLVRDRQKRLNNLEPVATLLARMAAT